MLHVMTLGPDAASTGEAAAWAPEFRDFFEDEYERLGRAMFLLCGNADDAEDLTQEAFLRLYERWDRVRTMRSPDGYLYRTAMNLHRSRLRRLAAWARRRLEDEPGGGGQDPGVTLEVKDQIARALGALPAGQRAALVLVEWLGMTDEEAGRILGVAPVSVRVRISRARAGLRSQFGGDDG